MTAAEAPVMAEGPVTTFEGPVTTAEGPVATFEGPVTTPEGAGDDDRGAGGGRVPQAMTSEAPELPSTEKKRNGAKFSVEITVNSKELTFSLSFRFRQRF